MCGSPSHLQSMLYLFLDQVIGHRRKSEGMLVTLRKT